MKAAALSFDVRWFSHSQTPELNDAVCAFVSSRIWGAVKPFFYATSMAIFDGGNLIAGMIFHNFDRDAGVIEISGAASTPRWLTRPVLKEMFGYAFEELGCQAVVMRVDGENSRLGRILPAYGFNRYEIPRLRGRDKSEKIFVLHDDQWRNNGFHKE